MASNSLMSFLLRDNRDWTVLSVLFELSTWATEDVVIESKNSKQLIRCYNLKSLCIGTGGWKSLHTSVISESMGFSSYSKRALRKTL